ncbi:hypothetical protein RFI_12354 [Reticulomyxa filosa]|uniref:Uncharacterized protein n=1 Tax=Reticulomyxa filosa TaxID=46433 RepID=X6NFY0_RETFI|nr:hypothetical protein RFI_12354 [Reticulomyxa filosa]|eukprot:ETO24803.1 hypothetical protein RFI_12354 [Reticulomyxa filosa]
MNYYSDFLLFLVEFEKEEKNSKLFYCTETKVVQTRQLTKKKIKNVNYCACFNKFFSQLFSFVGWSSTSLSKKEKNFFFNKQNLTWLDLIVLFCVIIMGCCIKRQSGGGEEKKDDDLVSFYKSKQRMIRSSAFMHSSVRVMTYNILADGEAYALSDFYPYTDIKQRQWNYRFPRVLAQIQAYDPDIVCMQETTPRTYNQRCVDLLLLFFFFLLSIHFVACNSQQEMHTHSERERERERSIHQKVFDLSVVYKNKKKNIKKYKNMYIKEISSSNLLQSERGALVQSDAIFFKTSTVEVINWQVIRLGSEAEREEHSEVLGPLSSDFRSSLKTKFDVAIALHCRFQNHSEFVAVTTHLFWNPRFPDLKAAQAFLLSHALHRVMEDEWKLDLAAIPVVIGLDSNSLPFKDVEDIFNPKLPKEGLVSGVYTLWTTGKLPREHLDHPCTRVPYWSEHSTTEDAVGKFAAYIGKKNVEAAKQLPDWSVPKTMIWKSAYKEASCDSKEPPFTTKTNTFAGCLDYIFFNDKFRVGGFLEMPWQNGLTYHIPPRPTKGDVDTNEAKWTEEREKNSLPSTRSLLCLINTILMTLQHNSEVKHKLEKKKKKIGIFEDLHIPNKFNVK